MQQPAAVEQPAPVGRAARFKAWWKGLPKEDFWTGVVGLGALLRMALIFFYRGPMDNLYSDAHRHMDNARHFLEPGPMGCSNPYFYQLFLWIVISVTKEQRFLMHLTAALLSVSYPFLWYRFARAVTHEKVTALRFAAVITFLPTHATMFTLFMNETLLLPLMGGALWASVVAVQRRSGWRFLLAVFLWTCALLTRSIALPMAGVVLLWCLWHQKKRPLFVRPALALGGAAIAGVGLWVAAQHSVRILERRTPFGDNINVTAYFVSGAFDYTITYKKPGKFVYGYGFGSPSFAISPFDPFYQWKTSRKGKLALVLDIDKKGEDGKKVIDDYLKKNRSILPRLIWENLIFLTFGHSWPEAGKIGLLGNICLWERWIWFPVGVSAMIGSLVFFRRRRRFFFVPAFTLFALASLLGAQLTVMEGRYRHPVEPILLLCLFWLVEMRRYPDAKDLALPQEPSAPVSAPETSAAASA